MQIELIGAGNVAWHIAKSLLATDIKVAKVYNRTIEKAAGITAFCNAEPLMIDNLGKNSTSENTKIIALTDNQIQPLLPKLPKNNAVLIHTAGSVTMDVFERFATNYGVMYPLQTLVKGQNTDYSSIPLLIEANNTVAYKVISQIAQSISHKVYEVNSEKRRQYHICGVMLNNFTNHLFSKIYDRMEMHGLDKSYVKALAEETFQKVLHEDPYQAQTGPARRKNKEIIEAHLKQLEDDAALQELYHAFSKSILNYY